MRNRRARRMSVWVMAALAMLYCVSRGQAQTESGTFNVVCLADPKVEDFTKRRACRTGTQRLTFGDEVTLAVEHAPETTFDDSSEPNPADTVLFLDGKALAGTYPAVGPSKMADDGVTTTLLTYPIHRDLSTEGARKNWKEVMAAAQAGRPLTISAGLEKGGAARSEAGQVEFMVFRTNRLVWWFIGAVVGVILFFVIAARTGALRDKEPAGGDVSKTSDRAFSLSRVQMALWTMLVLYAYIFIWILTGEYNATIPASAVALMGITLATFGAAAAVDATKVQTNKEKLQVIRGKRSGTQPTPGDEEKDIESQTKVCKSEGFFRDITTSAEGASLHRLQLIVWTLALASVFVVTVWRTLAMPDFDSTLLALMGISSGAYVGLKLPERKG